MLQAFNDKQQLIHAKDALPGKYICPVCQQPVILKKGKVKTPHFSHQSIKDCFTYMYKKESLAHIAGKYQLYELFTNGDCFLEYYLPEIEQIPDCFHRSGIALELQLSVIPAQHIYLRTLGYDKLGLKVIWIAKYEDIKLNGNRMKLTHFQAAMLCLKSHVLMTYHTKLQQFIALICLEIININEYLVQVKVVEDGQTLLSIMKSSQFKCRASILNHKATRQHINNCLSKRSVLEPTLSGLYQLQIDRRDIPDSLRIILPEQMYIRTHPILWQVQLNVMLRNQTFQFSQFVSLLNLTEQSSRMMCRERLSLKILKEYQQISSEMRALITEK